MTTPTYTPRAGSLASQVIGFFRHKPDEELLLDDITDKFDATRGNIHTLLADAVKADLLARYRNADGDYVYKPGTACGVYAVPDVTIAATVAKAADAQMAAIDFDALQVDDGVAYQPAAGVKGFSKWDPLFARLTKAGQSVELPRALRDRLFTECGKRNKKTGAKTWAISSTGPDTCRLWRLL
jgi:hypothetical protein